MWEAEGQGAADPVRKWLSVLLWRLQQKQASSYRKGGHKGVPASVQVVSRPL